MSCSFCNSSVNRYIFTPWKYYPSPFVLIMHAHRHTLLVFINITYTTLLGNWSTFYARLCKKHGRKNCSLAQPGADCIRPRPVFQSMSCRERKAGSNKSRHNCDRYLLTYSMQLCSVRTVEVVSWFIKGHNGQFLRGNLVSFFSLVRKSGAHTWTCHPLKI
jgi:hypothetical protein